MVEMIASRRIASRTTARGRRRQASAEDPAVVDVHVGRGPGTTHVTPDVGTPSDPRAEATARSAGRGVERLEIGPIPDGLGAAWRSEGMKTISRTAAATNNTTPM